MIFFLFNGNSIQLLDQGDVLKTVLIFYRLIGSSNRWLGNKENSRVHIIRKNHVAGV